MNNKMKAIFIALIVLNAIVLGIVLFLWILPDPHAQANKNLSQTIQRRTFTLSELAHYNGFDPKRPIYLALDGYVYDVSQGREFYQVGGPYHDLAGKDASVELHLVGGGIIKSKYPVVGTLYK